MKKTTFFSLAALLLGWTLAQAQYTPDSVKVGWKRTLVLEALTTQSAYSDSWVGGEAGSVNYTMNLNGKFERYLSEYFGYRMTIKLSFGQTLTQDAETKKWDKPEKSTDLIDWENVGTFSKGWGIDPFVALRLESQFLNASVPEKKRYLTPLTLTESAGGSRRFYEKDEDLVVSRLGFALKETFKNSIIDSATFATKDSTLIDGGIESVTDVYYHFNDKLQVTSKLTLFKALFFSEKDAVKGTEFENDWKAIDVNWENIISGSLSKIVTVQLYTQFLYDKQVSRKGRLKETLGIGLTFKML
jgi:hypothetical protein